MDLKDLINWIIFGIIFLIEAIIEIVGSIYYNSTPNWVWGIANGLVFAIPLLQGIIKGLLCLIPNIICEIIWLILKGYIGTILHSISFLICNLILGIMFIVTKRLKLKIKLIIYPLLFESFLLLEEMLYYFMRKIFLSKKNEFTWKNISVSFMTIVNPVLFIIFIFGIYYLDKINNNKEKNKDDLPDEIEKLTDSYE
jgi:hypothetical protein